MTPITSTTCSIYTLGDFIVILDKDDKVRHPGNNGLKYHGLCLLIDVYHAICIDNKLTLPAPTYEAPVWNKTANYGQVEVSRTYDYVKEFPASGFTVTLTEMCSVVFYERGNKVNPALNDIPELLNTLKYFKFLIDSWNQPR